MNNENFGNSLLLFATGQVSYALSFLTSLEIMFKLLSIISVGMIIIINWKTFIDKIKELCSRFKK